MALVCQVPVNSRRRFFWATQPDACGTNEVCGNDCGSPGLGVVQNCNPQSCDPTQDPNCPPVDNTTKTFATTEWLRGLIINMLMTDGLLPDTECGYRPGSQGGHWSESYIADAFGGPTIIGTLMRTPVATRTVQEAINLIVAYAKDTMSRLVARGVAISVDVTGSYIGGGRMKLDILVRGRTDGEARVGLVGQRLAQGWVWQ